jgi:glycosyltransferase involved in cell wall biosynthesis
MRSPFRLGIFSAHPLRTFSGGLPHNLVTHLQRIQDVQVTVLPAGPTYRPSFRKRLWPGLARRWSGKTYLWEKEPARCRYYSRQLDEAVQRQPVDAVLLFGSELCADAATSVPLYGYGDSLFGSRIDLYPDQQSNAMNPASIAEGRAVQQRALERLRKLFLSSRWAWDRARERFGYAVPDDRVEVVGIGANLPVVPPPEVEPVPLASRFAWVGNFWERKGGAFALDLVEALRQTHPEATLEVIGDVQPQQRPAWLHLHGKLNYENPADFQRLQGVYRGAAGLLLPSTGDLTPLAIAEAFAFSRPVFATTVGAIPEMIQEGRTGLLFKERSVAHWAGRLGEALTSGRLATMRAACREAYETKFNWPQICEYLVNVIRDGQGPR